MKIVTLSLPPATVGEAYFARLDVVDGTEPYTWALDGTSDPLPTGLVLSPAGEISGTPVGAPQTHTNLVFEATDSTPTVLASLALSMLVQPGAYKQATTYLMEDKVNDMVTRVFGDGDQVNRFEFMRHFLRSRDPLAGEPTYLRLLQYLHDSGEIQSPQLVNAGLPLGNSVRAALILLDTLLGGATNLPFTVLPDPTGVAATDTAALNAVWADPLTKDWLIIPPSATAYSLNADITSGSSRNFKLWAAGTVLPHFTSAGPVCEVQDLVECRDVGFDEDVIPASVPGASFGDHLRIFGGSVYLSSGIELFASGVGEIRHATILLDPAVSAGSISDVATNLKVEDCYIHSVEPTPQGYTVLTISTIDPSFVTISNNRISDRITSALAGSIWDLRSGTAASSAMIGSNVYEASGMTSPYVTTGHLGALAISPQAYL